MNQLFKSEQLIGKTIENIIDGNDMYIKFTDGSFTRLEVKDISVGFESEKYVVAIDDSLVEKTETALFELGIITKDEHIQAIHDEDERMKKVMAEIEKESIELIEQYEREQLKKLQEKYK